MGKSVKKNEKKRYQKIKFSNLKTPIPSEYCPTYFFLNDEQLLYINYELFKL